MRGEGSEEVSENTSLFYSMTEGGRFLLSLEGGISAPVVSVRTEKCGAREEPGC